jgi:single-strand DNA-binding protein
MSADFATMQVNGRMTGDPKKFDVGTTSKAVFSVAVNRRFKNKKTDEWDKRTTYIDCVAWGPNAAHVEQHGKKGAKVAMTGNWETDRYVNNKQEEVKRSHVNVNNISIFTVREDSETKPADSEEIPF